MKKILVLLLVMFLVSGCTSIKDAKMEEIVLYLFIIFTLHLFNYIIQLIEGINIIYLED